MNLVRKPKIVVLGLMSKMPVAGIVWLTMQHVVGFKRLGYDVYYVEEHARTPSMLMEHEDEDGSAKAAAFIADVMRRFDMGDRWAFHALHDDGRCFGMSEGQLKQLFRDAALIINMHGGTEPLPDHYATGRLVYLGTDPVEVEIQLYHDEQATIDYLEPHCAFFTWGENYGNPDCGVPVSQRFDFKPTRQPVVLDLWQPYRDGPADTFTTIGNWRQIWREISFQGEVYHWSKHYEFMKFIDLPRRTSQMFELALSGYEEADRHMLESRGWRVQHALGFSIDVDGYSQYIGQSRGEFTVAKDQNVRLRSGWFSDRSATYLATGRTVITQETGFSNILPTGAGLFGFSTMDEILGAVERINANYERHCRAAFDLAREYFSYDVVLPRMLADVGLSHLAARPSGASSTQSTSNGNDVAGGSLERTEPAIDRAEPAGPFPSSLVLSPVSRGPTKLPEATVRTVLDSPILISLPQPSPIRTVSRRTSIVIVTFDNLVYTRLCLESLLANTDYPDYEVIIVDNGSTDGTADYLRCLARHYSHVRVVFNDHNCGFAPSSNQGLALASGDVLVLLNNDTIVPRGWLARLVRHLQDPAVGLIGPVTNRTCNEAQIEVTYRTYGEFVQFARDHLQTHEGERFDIRMLALFCAAMRRDVCERIGALDERYEVGMFEDDDYAMRVHAAGYRMMCAEDVFVHHFGQASLGKLMPTGEYGELFHANRRRFEEKWGVAWEPHERWRNQEYQQLVQRIREVVHAALPDDTTVLVVSKGDDELLNLDVRRAWHFPQTEDGVYAGYYPADSAEAIEHLEALRASGADFLLFPNTALWWLEHYPDFKQHLERQYSIVLTQEDTCMIFALAEANTLQADTLAHSDGVRAIDHQNGGFIKMNKRRTQELTTDEEAIQRDLAALRQLVQKHTKQLEGLAAKVKLLSSREVNRSAISQSMYEQLLCRDDDIQASLYDLELATMMQSGNSHSAKQVAYQQLIRRIREVVRNTVPYDATVIIVSKGDNELLDLYGRQAWHFPQTREGIYAGHYPRNSRGAIIQLEALRARGADFLLFPQTALWWLDHYAEFKQHLERCYHPIVRREDTCVIYALRRPAGTGEMPWGTQLEDLIAEHQSLFDQDPAILNWNTGLNLAVAFPQYTIFSPPSADGTLPYLDASIDIVAVASDDLDTMAEAHRVAKVAVVSFSSTDGDTQSGFRLSVNRKLGKAAPTLPKTSIIIPTYNGFAVTKACLTALGETLPYDFNGEVIIVDDGSTDDTQAQLQHWARLDDRLKILRNPRNVGFIASCNQGARAATGEILIFLNNDTVPLSNWLPPLLRIFRDCPDAGAVGGKLIFPDGTLQEAGGIVFCDGSAANFGRGDYEIDALLYNFVREVDYCSGALLATRRSFFEELGGFDTHYEPAYYEDTDYCFKVRAKGYRVYYQPESAIIHMEGASSGTDVTRGVKRYQVVNQEKFLARWSDALKRQPSRPGYSDLLAWRALAVRTELEGAGNR